MGGRLDPFKSNYLNMFLDRSYRTHSDIYVYPPLEETSFSAWPLALPKNPTFMWICVTNRNICTSYLHHNSPFMASLIAQLLKNLSAMQETLIQFLGRGSGRSPGEEIGYLLQCSWTSLISQLVKNPPAMQETWVQSLGWEDPLEKGKATHSSILVWRLPEAK